MGYPELRTPGDAMNYVEGTSNRSVWWKYTAVVCSKLPAAMIHAMASSLPIACEGCITDSWPGASCYQHATTLCPSWEPERNLPGTQR